MQVGPGETQVTGDMATTGEGDRQGEAGGIRATCLRLCLLAPVLLTPAPLLAEPGSGATPGVTTEKTGALPRREIDPAAVLALRRDSTRRELDALSRTISLTEEKARALE